MEDIFTPLCSLSILGRQNACQVDKTGQAVSSVVNSVTLASPQGNGGFGEDNRYLGAYRGMPASVEAVPAFSFSTPEAYWDGLPPKGLETEFPVILDLVANRLEAQNKGLERDCPSGFITGHCEDGHRFVKEVYCGREWCEVCNGKWVKGQDMKPSHARRFSRWYPKAQQIDSMGYWVFTIPLQARGRFRTKEALTGLGHDIQELLKENGFKRGFKRWHFFGDESSVYNPHLNCLVDGGKLGKKALRKIRREYSKLLGVKLAIANYEYSSAPGKKVHWLTYVTRATFLDPKWDIAMALELRGFHTTSLWGRQIWTGKPVWSLKDLPGKNVAGMSDSQARAVGALELGYCLHDGLKIVWEGYVPQSHFWGIEAVSIGAGYWEYWTDSIPPHWRDGNEYERMCYSREVVDKALVLSGLPPQFGHGAKRANLACHKRFVYKKAVEEEAWTEILTGQVGHFAGGNN